MAPTRAVLLDLWGTTAWGEPPPPEERLSTQLGVPEAVLFDAFERTLVYRGTGGPASVEESLAVVVAACGLDPEPGFVRRLTEMHVSFLRRGVHLYDDTVQVLGELRGRGMKTAIVSNCDHFTRPAVEALGLEDEVDAVILSFEVGAMKPDPSIYEGALLRLDVGAEDSTFVDDQAENCDGAVGLGIRALRIARDAVDHDDPKRHPLIHDLEALLRLV